jgi:hypothetical protein
MRCGKEPLILAAHQAERLVKAQPGAHQRDREADVVGVGGPPDLTLGARPLLAIDAPEWARARILHHLPTHQDRRVGVIRMEQL